MSLNSGLNTVLFVCLYLLLVPILVFHTVKIYGKMIPLWFWLDFKSRNELILLILSSTLDFCLISSLLAIDLQLLSVWWILIIPMILIKIVIFEVMRSKVNALVRRLIYLLNNSATSRSMLLYNYSLNTYW